MDLRNCIGIFAFSLLKCLILKEIRNILGREIVKNQVVHIIVLGETDEIKW